MYEVILSKAIDIVKECGMILENQSIESFECKKDHQDIVTKLDKETEDILKKRLCELLPESTVLAEEASRDDSDLMWIIDPIDGTTNFVNMHQDFAISVALYKEHQPLFGIVYDVMNHIVYSGIKNKGAFINGIKVDAKEINLKLSNALWDASLGTILSWPKLTELFLKTRGHRSLGCASLAIIRVGLSKLDFYISSHVKVWDYAASMIFLSELNGMCWIEKDFFTVESTRAVFLKNEKYLEDIFS